MSLIHDLRQRLIQSPVSFWSADAGLSALLVSLTLYIFIISPLSKHYNTGTVLDVLFMFVLLSGVFSASPCARLRRLMLLAAIPAAVLRWVSFTPTQTGLLALQHGYSALFFGMIVLVLLVRVFERGPKTGHRVLAAVAVYLMQGLMWAALYQLVEVILPGAFQLPSSPSGLPASAAAMQSTFIYFSFVTLTSGAMAMSRLWTHSP